MSASASKSVAVVGIGCRFPGGADDPERFWSLLREGRDAIGDIPGDRLDLTRFYDPAPQTPGKTVGRYGGYLEGVDLFDAEFFGIAPRDAERLDPQHRLLLETAWEAMESAGVDLAALDGERVGVFVGQWLADFELRLFQHPEELDFSMTLGSGRYAAAGRISYAFNFTGPSITLDTACSSSLTAVHMAVQSLRAGESRLALAGGVNVILGPHIHVAYSQSGMMAPDGRCKFGDASADGYVRSEGAGVVVLKRLDDALRDGDRIHAVIRGSAVNNDGRSSGSMGTPSLAGQQDLLRRALADAEVDPLDIGYVEAHGTGTRAGDKVEIGALAAVLGPGRDEGAPLRVGSVKTNLGHTESAAGAAGLIKTVLAVRNGEIPGGLHLRTPNPDVPWDAAPIDVPQALTAWPAPGGVRRAGVSGFGISGANAHVVVEAPPAAEPRATEVTLPILPLSARSEAALRAMAGAVAEALAAPDAEELDLVLAFAQRRRTAHEYRAAFLAHDREGLVAELRRYAAGGDAPASGQADPRKPAKTALVFPGQGGQWAGMARQLMASEPVIREVLERAEAIIAAEAGWSLLEQLALDPGAAGYLGDRIDVVQPTLGAVSIAYAEWLESKGLAIDFVIGHSMGEAPAACTAGALTLEEALRVLCRRSRLMREKSGQGAMALVEAPRAEVEAALLGEEDLVSIAAVNSARATVISGDKARVEALVAAFTAKGVFSRTVNVDVASHSPQMESLAQALRLELAALEPRATDIGFISSVLGTPASGESLDAGYWARNLREPVRFADGVDALVAAGVNVFIEAGPHPVLAPSIEQAMQETAANTAVIACGRRAEPEQAVLLAALAKAWCAGAKVDWSLGAQGPAPVIDFPLYPWRRKRHWVKTAELSHALAGARRASAPDEAQRSWLHQVVWREVAAQPAEAARWLVIGEGPELVSALQAAGQSVETAALDRAEAALEAVGAQPMNVLVAAPPGEAAPYLPVRVGKALSSTAKVKVWFATAGAQDPEASGARRDVDHAALWGAARVLSDERPEIWGGLIDLPGEALQAAAAAAALAGSGGEDLLAVRDGRIFAARLTAAPEAPGEAVTWASDGTYLLTGGLGDVGLTIARSMVEDGARRLILASRTALPPRRAWAGLDPASAQGSKVARIRALESLGATIHLVSLDVADEDAVRGFLTDYEAEGWPPIRGVVHLAAALDRSLIADTTPQIFERAMAAKLRGAQILDRLLPDVDAFVVFSSMSTILPQPGMVGYVAANAGLEALAADRRARGKPAMAITWGHWHGLGLIGDEAGETLIGDLAKRGLGSFSPSQGAGLFAWAAGRADPVIAIMPTDWALYGSARAGRDEPLLKEVKGASGGQDFAERLAAASGPEKRALLADAVADAVARTLQLPATELDRTREFGAMGLSSLLAMELRNRLERRLRRPLAATLAWNYPTVVALADHLAGDPAPAAAPGATETPVKAPTALDARVAAMAEVSDADALAALRSRRKTVAG